MAIGSPATEGQVLGTPTTTLADVAAGICDRIEEVRGAPIFWSLTRELFPFVVEAMCESVLLTAEPEQRADRPYPLTAGTTLFQCPPEAVAVVRLSDDRKRPIPRTTVWDLDRNYPGWQRQQADRIRYWFPFGLNQFGVFPQLKTPQDVLLTYVALPNVSGRPYTGAEIVPFQTEFLDGLEDMGEHLARVKLGGLDLQQSMAQYNAFLAKMHELSNFASHKSAIRFSRQGGIAPAKASEP